MTIDVGSNEQGSKIVLGWKTMSTHVAVLGTTGSGKTGLLLGVAEEAYSQGVPLILVDIKGDLVNIALQQFGKASVRVVTPGASHGDPLDVFADLADKAKVSRAASSLLRLVNEDCNPIKSRAHSYLSTILDWRHRHERPTDLVSIIHAVQEPGFHHLGAMDIDVAFPKKSRVALATKLNQLVVSPSFQAWRAGINLDMDKLLEPVGQNTSVLIYSVAHLVNQDEQTFALSLLFDEMYQWLRKKGNYTGTSLRCMLVVDECVGLLPPHPKDPPTKSPLMLLLKQGRAFGLSCMLASQNPVDLDYKAMSNCNTWFIGRLTMDRDRSRVSKNVSANTSLAPDIINNRISALGAREFFIVRPSGGAQITTRDCMCELRGPILASEYKDLYESGHLTRIDVPARLRQLLFIARKQSMSNPSVDLDIYITSLEQQLEAFEPTKLSIVGGRSA